MLCIINARIILILSFKGELLTLMVQFSDLKLTNELLYFRFATTISAHINGHSHRVELHLNTASYNKSIAVNIALNGGAATAWGKANPNYCVYHVDGVSYEVYDYATWIYNLTEANLQPNQTPNWFLQHNFKAKFGVDPSAAGVQQLTETFLTNIPLLREYWRCKITRGDPLLRFGCNNDCLRNQRCQIIRNDFHVDPNCATNETESQAEAGILYTVAVKASILTGIIQVLLEKSTGFVSVLLISAVRLILDPLINMLEMYNFPGTLDSFNKF